MKHRTLRGAAALALGASLLLAGCSSDDGGSDDPTSPSPSASTDAPTSSPEDVAALEKVKVTGDPGKAATVKFDAPLTVTAPTSRVITEGTGDDLVEGKSFVSMQYTGVQGSDGTTLGSTWDNDTPESFIFGDQNYGVLSDPLKGQKVGARVLIAMPDQSGGTVIDVVDVVDSETLPAKAEGTAVKPADGLPTVKLDDSGKPSITIPDGYKEPKDLVVQPLIKGAGPKVTEDQTVAANYTGWTLDGKEFDSSWSRGTPTSFSLQQVVPGWTQGLSGQTVGSQVLLVIPPDLAYGEPSDENTSELAGQTLVFVVDILGAR